MGEGLLQLLVWDNQMLTAIEGGGLHSSPLLRPALGREGWQAQPPALSRKALFLRVMRSIPDMTVDPTPP